MKNLNDFQEAMKERGLIPPTNFIADGRFHRCDVDKPRGKNDGSYLLRQEDGRYFGVIQNWSDGKDRSIWFSDEALGMNKNKDHFKKKVMEINKRYKDEIQSRQEAAKIEANRIWNAAHSPDLKHPYLLRKQIAPIGIKQALNEAHESEQLIVPIRDSSKQITSLLFIDADGKKLFLAGGKVKGGYLVLGQNITGHICICEGYATGISIHTASELTTVVAFSCGNLQAVGSIIRTKFPDKILVYCADNDASNSNNPGLNSAEKAAKCTNGLIAIPLFKDNRADGGDFNDLQIAEGKEAVSAIINSVINTGIRTEKTETNNRKPKNTFLELGTFLGKKPSNPKWLWSNFIPAAALTILYGRAEVGKTTIAMSIIATLSNGGNWPVTNEQAPTCSVLLQESEDDFNRTLGLLMAQGANLSRVIPMGLINECEVRRPFSISKDLSRLEEVIEKNPDIKLIVLSPITAFVDINDQNSAAQLRRALTPLFDFIHRTGVAVLGIAHPRKGTGGHVHDSLSGSHVWIDAARSVLLAIEDLENPDRRYMGTAKLNVSKDKLTHFYTIEGVDVEGENSEIVKTSKIAWGDQFASESVKSIFDRLGEYGTKDDSKDVSDWLEGYLFDGPRTVTEVREAAIADGFQYVHRTFQKALERIRGYTYREKDGFASKWLWSLIPQAVVEGNSPTGNATTQAISTSEIIPLSFASGNPQISKSSTSRSEGYSKDWDEI